MSIEQRVVRGVKLLDAREPGWRDRIAPGDLEMRSCERCVLGQLFAYYHRGLDKLKLLRDKVVECGFAAQDFDYPALQAEWLRHIKGEP